MAKTKHLLDGVTHIHNFNNNGHWNNYNLRSDSTSYASDISLKFSSACCLLSGFLSGCHFRANLRYLWKKHNKATVIYELLFLFFYFYRVCIQQKQCFARVIQYLWILLSLEPSKRIIMKAKHEAWHKSIPKKDLVHYRGCLKHN